MSRARHILAADYPQLIQTLSSAFFDDPVTAWMFNDPERRANDLSVWNRFVLEMSLTRGHAYSAGGNRVAALWSPPDVTLFDEFYAPRMVELLKDLLAERADEVLPAMARALAGHGSDEPHFYLFMLGTHAESQGKGLGSQVLEPVLALCDAQGLPAHLESSNVRNQPFYLRHGFEVVSEIQLAEDGPSIWPMRREPR